MRVHVNHVMKVSFVRLLLRLVASLVMSAAKDTIVNRVPIEKIQMVKNVRLIHIAKVGPKNPNFANLDNFHRILEQEVVRPVRADSNVQVRIKPKLLICSIVLLDRFVKMVNHKNVLRVHLWPHQMQLMIVTVASVPLGIFV